MAIFFTFAGSLIITGILLEVWGRNKLARRRRADMIAAAVRGSSPDAGYIVGVALGREPEGWCEYCGTTGLCPVCGSEHGE